MTFITNLKPISMHYKEIYDIVLTTLDYFKDDLLL